MESYFTSCFSFFPLRLTRYQPVHHIKSTESLYDVPTCNISANLYIYLERAIKSYKSRYLHWKFYSRVCDRQKLFKHATFAETVFIYQYNNVSIYRYYLGSLCKSYINNTNSICLDNNNFYNFDILKIIISVILSSTKSSVLKVITNLFQCKCACLSYFTIIIQ